MPICSAGEPCSCDLEPLEPYHLEPYDLEPSSYDLEPYDLATTVAQTLTYCINDDTILPKANAIQKMHTIVYNGALE